MSQKIAVAVVHGIGKQERSFAQPFARKLRRKFAKAAGDLIGRPEEQLVIEPVFWQECIQEREDELWKRVKDKDKIHWRKSRRMLIDLAGDAIAYQPADSHREMYRSIHAVLAKTLTTLADRAGEKAPLCIVAHSLGTIIVSNYLYDLYTQYFLERDIIDESVRSVIGSTPLERGETLSHLYTFGSPLAVWSLRYADFGTPVTVPSPMLKRHWPAVNGEWINYYDREDVIGFPLRSVNEAYARAVTEDIAVDVGNPLWWSWNPLCHTKYWKSGRIATRIAATLKHTWHSANGEG